MTTRPSGRVERLARSQYIDCPLEEVFAFFSDAANLEALTPPFLQFAILTPLPIEMGAGTRIEYQLGLYGVPVRWRTHITQWEPGVQFADEQESGPYAYWRHTHTFEPEGEGTRMVDVVEYQLPLGPLGIIAHGLFVRRTLERIFDFRADQVDGLLGQGRTTRQVA